MEKNPLSAPPKAPNIDIIKILTSLFIGIVIMSLFSNTDGNTPHVRLQSLMDLA